MKFKPQYLEYAVYLERMNDEAYLQASFRWKSDAERYAMVLSTTFDTEFVFICTTPYAAPIVAYKNGEQVEYKETEDA